MGVFIEDPLAHSMAHFKFTSAMLNKGTTFIFGSSVCVANDPGGFNSHLARTREPEASAADRRGDLDKFVNNLGEMLVPDLAREIEEESAFDATSTRAAPRLHRSNPIWSEEDRTRLPFRLRNAATVY